MDIIKPALVLLVIYFLAVSQTSFLVHFRVFSFIPNFLFIIAVIWNIIENPKKNFGLFFAVAAGFFLDIFSSHTIGFNIAILFAISISLKFILRRYVRNPFAENT